MTADPHYGVAMNKTIINSIELTRITKFKVLQKLEALAQSRKDCEFAIEGVLPEEDIEDGMLVTLLALPV